MSDAAPRYAVGIDLGTTNSVLAAIDLDAAGDGDDEAVVETLALPQLTAPGSVEARPQLPSFAYLPHPDELSAGDRRLPWGEPAQIVGTLARELGARTPLRLIASAKSWLSHAGVDRRAALLPADADDEPGISRLSPLDASALYLQHLRAAWDHAYPDAPLAAQTLTLTVPASFDPAARELTVEAARRAGLGNAVLLEEPQAALYSWIQRSAGGWREQVAVGELILVVDIGGGTTDLSLIAVSDDAGSLSLNRVAVGDHILLGGDNMDLALANVIRAKLAADGKQLELWQLRALAHGCRDAKERLLADPDAGAASVPVVVPGRGSRLLGSTLKSELSGDEVRRTLLEGFFPQIDADARPAARRRGALTRLGLPYAQDAAITRHLAAFLHRQRDALDAADNGGEPPLPQAVLFNGGALRAPLLAERVMTTLNGWLAAAGREPARMLSGTDLDLAVARGAAYYGRVRRGRGVRIRGGTAKSYYVGIETAMPAIPGMDPPLLATCIAPFGMEEGSSAEPLADEVGLIVGEPVRFRFFGSSTRRDDRVGTALERWDDGELDELDEVGTEFNDPDRAPGEVVPVRLRASVSEVGTLKLEALPRDGGSPWDVEFDTRGTAV